MNVRCKGMNEIEAFLNGIKPTLLLAEQQKPFTTMLAYPNAEIHLIPNRRQCLFFPTEEKMREWQERTAGITHTTPEFHRELGLTLGYPPKAVDFYVRRVKCEQEGRLNELKRLKLKVVGMHYAGISCNGSGDDIIHNVRWLWDRYRLAEPLKVRIDTSFITVDYRDEKVLTGIAEETTVTLVS
ncbi:hypothetical protein ACFO25_00205 [Paenactinomyces guangxiensis]|uniref:Uncharacterized protein n=1 Tax=Paenactinomyces guangxiensis TaxID=1490290 RepID=A0A7W2A9J4_9BACL|nr:hypothetical protein [Paenactinomyces guangxiensis]MBA4495257.1 hypothetical protein [Paenactinomyces guangxiensis]MBH8592341.1 hypothetical protein [Paenactinomyces guangxiensis]